MTRVRELAVTIAMTLGLLGPELAWASGSKAYEDGTRHLEEMHFEDAARTFQRALKEGGLTREQLVGAYSGLGLAAASVADDDTATWAFERLLSLEPGWGPPPWFSPEHRALSAAKVRTAGTPLALQVTAPAAAAGEAAQLSASVRADRLQMVRGFRARWTLDGDPKEVLSHDGELRIETAERALRVRVLVEALDARGSTVAAREVELALDGEQSAAAFRRVHLWGAAYGHLLSRGVGGEVGVGVRVAAPLALGVAASLGARLGGQLTLTFSAPRGLVDGAVRPFIQARAVYFPGSAEGSAWGGGMSGGLGLALGRGQLIGGLIAEAYAAPATYRPHALMGILGYQADLF